MAAPRRWLLLAAGASASIHDLVVDKDRRALYRIESFCFVEGGRGIFLLRALSPNRISNSLNPAGFRGIVR